MPLTKLRRQTYSIALFAVMVALVGNITVFAVARHADANLKRQRQRGDAQLKHERTLADAKLKRTRINGRLFFCTEIEKLKTAQRQTAIKNYDDLDKNGKLLGITITDKLRDAARKGRDATLKTYKAVDCDKLAHSDTFPLPPSSTEP